MVKVIVHAYPILPAKNDDERQALRPIGRNKKIYQDVLKGWNDIIRFADEIGVWGVSSVEHHFHSEGFEVGPAPGILNAYWAANTRNIRVGALGYVMTTHDPLRVAEETAVLSHLAEGRTFVGFSRGYQSRWTDVMGQAFSGVATLSDGREDDQRNRVLFEEHVDLVLKAWTQENFAHHSDIWTIPKPATPSAPWPLLKWTRKFGGEGEVGEDGQIAKISVVPAPYQDEHPPVFIASNSSRQTIEWAATRGFIPVYFSSIHHAKNHGPAYVSAASRAGLSFTLGKNQAIVRWPTFGQTREQAYASLAAHSGSMFKQFYEPFQAAMKGEPSAFPDYAPLEATVQPMLESGLFIAGSVEDVRNEFVKQWKDLPAEYVVLMFHYAQQPKESVIEDIGLFMKEVKPALDDLTKY